jgi:iron(III) transport system substrate-binding protein
MALVLAALVTGCQASPGTDEIVVVYTSVDQPFAEPVLAGFEEETGIAVQAVYDIEAAKTTGLVNRLIAEKDLPKADVFWNNEIIQTIVLKEEGVLDAYLSPNAQQVPRAYRDPENHWTGVTARARVLVVNTDRIAQPDVIASIYDLLDPTWRGQDVGIAYPLFGTTATHAAALYEVWGAEQGRDYFEQLAERGVRVVDGNSVVRDLVADGQLAFGLTDTDDACGALARGAPVAINLPDQDDLGTLVIPSTVMMIAGAPHPEQGRALVDYLLTEEVEEALIEAGFSHIPLHQGIENPVSCLATGHVRGMDVDYEAVYRYFEVIQAELRDVFLR